MNSLLCWLLLDMEYYLVIINSLVYSLYPKKFHSTVQEKLINKIRGLRWNIYSSLRFVHFDVKVLPKPQETFPITDTPSVQFYTLTNGNTLGWNKFWKSVMIYKHFSYFSGDLSSIFLLLLQYIPLNLSKITYENTVEWMDFTT